MRTISSTSKKTLILFSGHSNSDRSFAATLADELRRIGRSVTLGFRQPLGPLRENDRYLSQLDTPVVLACLSSDAINDKELQDQISQASQDNDKLIVALILDSKLEMSERLRSANTTFLVWQDFDNTFPKLLTLLSGNHRGVASDELRNSEGPLALVDSQTLREAAQHAGSKLEEIARSTGEEFDRLSNEEALIGHLPKWHHLFMGAYGAFARPEKEHQILFEIDRCLGKLRHNRAGCVLHVVSGDSGCGKSTLAKQVIRRLIERDVPPSLTHISAISDKLQFFDVRPLAMKSALAHMQDGLAGAPYVLFYVDDLFALDDAEINDLLRALLTIAEKRCVYLFATSPSWLFDRKDLQEKKRTFQLVDTVETVIGGIDEADREALKQQYLEMHKEDFRPELFREIERAGDELILFKIALHHNLSYSEYFDQLFRRLEIREPKCLTGLLLFSILARFYVHFPVNLIKRLNIQLSPGDKLWESEYDYETTNDAGLRLFRYRRGNRTLTNPTGMPDTVAPFHDRIAQIIYSTWGENRRTVPIFNCSLRDLRNKVYQILDTDAEGKLVLSRLFRGHLRVANDEELAAFVKHFGPVRGRAWAFADLPEAAYLWISYSKYRSDRTRHFRYQWESALLWSMRSSKHESLYLTLILLNPSRLSDPQFQNKLGELKLEELDSTFFSIIRGVLGALLGRFPLPIEALGEYLLKLAPWLEARVGDVGHSLPYRYYVVASFASNSARIFSRFRPQEKINDALSQIIKSYLLNLEFENATNDLLGVRGLLPLVRRIHWSSTDAEDISNGLMTYLKSSHSRFKSVLFEHLVHFRLLAHSYEMGAVFELFLTICREDPSFRGHTYIPDALWKLVSRVGRRQPAERDALLSRVLSDFTEGNLKFLETSTVYPDFLSGLIDELVYTDTRGSTDALFAMFRPLVEKFPNDLEVPYVFIKAGRLHPSFLESLAQTQIDVTRREIRLCFASRLGISPESVRDEFIDLLTGNHISASYAVVAVLTYYLRSKNVDEVPDEVLSEQRRRFYKWLGEHTEDGKGAPYITLVETPTFFSTSELEKLGKLIAKNIDLIPTRIHPRFFPLKSIEWWLSNAARAEENREATHAILDAYWKFILQNADVQFQDRFVCYHDHFLFLFTKYALETDEPWWAKAVTRLINFLSALLERELRQGRRHEEARYLAAQYRSRLCLKLILEAIRKQFDHQRHLLSGEFERAVGAAFEKYRNEAWAAEWILMLGAEDLDGTATFINYWNSIDAASINAFHIRNQTQWWYDWLCSSSRDLGLEIKRLSQWLEDAPFKDLVAYLLVNVLEVTKKVSFKFSWGSLVTAVMNDSRPEFESKSLLLKRYTEYLSSYDSEDQLLASELSYLERVVAWYIKECVLRKNSKNAVYGLTNVFEVAATLEISIDIEAAEEAFSVVSAAQIKDDGTSSIAKKFFKWRLKKGSEVSIGKYIQLIKSDLEHDQAQWILLFLLEVMAENSFHPQEDDFVEIWALEKSLMERKLTQPVSLASKWLFENLILNYESFPNGLTVLRDISREFYDLCEKLVDNRRVTFLLSSFKTLSADLVEYPTTTQMLQLWRKLLERVPRAEIEAFSRFTSRLYKYLETAGNADELLALDQTLLDFLETRPGDQLSPKFFSMLSKRGSFLPQLGDNVVRLITEHKNLEDSAHVIGRFFHFAGPSLDHDTLVRCEASVILTLRQNIWKPHAASVMQLFLPLCTRRIHYEAITELFKAYLQSGGEQQSNIVIYRVMAAYHGYEVESEIDSATQRAGVEACLSIIQANAKREIAPKYFTVILSTWEVEFISQDLAMSVLRTLIATIHPSRWRRVLAVFAQLSRLFGPSSILCSGITLESGSAEITELEQEGLISLNRRIEEASALPSSK